MSAGIREVGQAVNKVRIDIKTTGRRAVAGRHPIRSTAAIDREKVAIHSRLPFRVGYGLPLGIDTLRPIQGNKRFGDDVRSVGAIAHEEIAVTRRLRQQFARSAVNLSVEKDWGLGVVPVVRIV